VQVEEEQGGRGPASTDRRRPGRGTRGRHRDCLSRGGEGPPDTHAPDSSEREREGRRAGAHGPARRKEKWVGPEETIEFLIYSNNFQTSSDCFNQKVDLPSSKKIK
jgi:hypothetical protein